MNENYALLLQDSRWRLRRQQILIRDNFTCQLCGSNVDNLNVHHRYYQKGKNPWDYPDDAMVTLCEYCHEHLHYETSCEIAFIGGVYIYEHGDFTNTGIVYDINNRMENISILEYDNGSSVDSVFDNTVSFSYFRSRYCLCENFLSPEFCRWFVYVNDHIYETPSTFRYFLNERILNNKKLSYILKNREKYEY